MKTYVLTIIGTRKVTLSLEGSETVLWTLDFAGMLTAARATKEAIRFLRRRGEALAKPRLELTDFNPTDLVWTYRIVTQPLATASKPAAPNAGIVCQLTIGHHSPGVGDPER